MNAVEGMYREPGIALILTAIDQDTIFVIVVERSIFHHNISSGQLNDWKCEFHCFMFMHQSGGANMVTSSSSTFADANE